MSYIFIIIFIGQQFNSTIYLNEFFLLCLHFFIIIIISLFFVFFSSSVFLFTVRVRLLSCFIIHIYRYMFLISIKFRLSLSSSSSSSTLSSFIQYYIRCSFTITIVQQTMRVLSDIFSICTHAKKHYTSNS